MQKTNRLFSGVLAALVMGSTALLPVAAGASEEGRRNTALGLGAITGYLFTRGGSKVPAFVGLGASAYAYKQYQDKVNQRHHRERAAHLNRYYRSAYSSGYSAGRSSRAHRSRSRRHRRY